MSTHALFSPSSADRWIRCPGSMAFPENQKTESSGGVYADEGTAAHTLASWCLQQRKDAYAFIGTPIVAGANSFTVDEEFAAHVQTYVDDVRRRAIGGQLMVEQQVSIAELETFGTSDAIIVPPMRAPDDEVDAEVEDLKFGRGEAVYAWSYADSESPFTMTAYEIAEDDNGVEVEPNYQLMLYAIGSLPIILMLLEQCRRIRLVINQPRLGIVSELVVTVDILERFAVYAADAKERAEEAMKITDVRHPKLLSFLNAGEKQCRWCKAIARCPKLAEKVSEEVGGGDEFEIIEAGGGTKPAVTPDQLSRAFRVIPLIRDWIREVETAANAVVAGGGEIIGIDKKPMKFVEGKKGDRAWINLKEAETALLGSLTEVDAYEPRKIISAAQAAKKLGGNKKKPPATWTDKFAPLIKRPDGKPILVLGSDPRPVFGAAAGSEEFENIEEQE
jgi:Protein of unknown function (DUF2800)